jgi:hypothetical protein
LNRFPEGDVTVVIGTPMLPGAVPAGAIGSMDVPPGIGC